MSFFKRNPMSVSVPTTTAQNVIDCYTSIRDNPDQSDDVLAVTYNMTRNNVAALRNEMRALEYECASTMMTNGPNTSTDLKSSVGNLADYPLLDGLADHIDSVVDDIINAAPNPDDVAAFTPAWTVYKTMYPKV